MKTIRMRPVLGFLPATVLFLLPLAVAAQTTPASAEPGAPPTCHGQQATLVGTPGEPLGGTDGPDVIVSNGASRVRAGAGDDLVCVTGDSGGPAIYDGPGDDVVDASTFSGYTVDTALGAGSDVYSGSPARDRVFLTGGQSDRDWVRTGAGVDYVSTDSRARLYVDADLAAGNDRVDVAAGVTFDLVGGPGRDSLVVLGCDCNRVAAWLGPDGTWEDGRQHSIIPGFENASVVAPAIEIYGSAQRNRVTVWGCDAVVHGRGGDDELTNIADTGDAQCADRVRLYGGPDDDLLRGGDYRDLLYGGIGHDTARGGGGFDLCRAELEASCEE